MNYPGGIGDVIAKAGSLQDKLYSNDNSIRKIKDYLSTICSYDDNIADFIVVSNDQTIFYNTGFSKQARTAIVSYPFLEDQWIKGVIANKEFVKVIRDNPSRYIYKGSEDVISFVGNTYDPAHIEKKQTVGAYIINVSLDRFTKSYKEYESSVKGDFVLSNAEGNVLYSSDKNFVLDPSKNLDSLITPLPDPSNEVELLGKHYIYNQSTVGSTPLVVANFVPKDLLWEYVKSSIWKVFYVLFTSLSVTILLMSLIFYMYSNRLKILVRFMEKVKQGDFTSRIHIQSEDEVGKLAEAFNEMCEQLNQLGLMHAQC